ncbi:LuxR family transcriptional regulator [Rhizobium etli]|uniref:LuxR family transcriptional regulator n=1 Tax=Rhizobium etli TaxID=29449 RepID=UPI0003838F0B|nr:LuxR family transcriptional regulator [Rhizobium etli]AGS25381.1 LuxR family transcriptional regulator protein [Rhizobium etli bv. mimosae str. Mim1]
MPFHKPATETLAVEFCRFLDQTDCVARSDQLFDLLSAFAQRLSCQWIAYGPPKHNQKVLTPAGRDPEVMLNYPDEWRKRCSEMGYDRIDPVTEKSRTRARAFRWSEVYNDASTTDIERGVFDEAARFGLRSGISVPIHGPNSCFAIMSFAESFESDFDHSTITYLQLAATHFHLKVAGIANSHDVESCPKLSLREKECILWVARGKSSWVIGTILGISQNTVDFHVKNVMEKLKVNSRTVAAMNALALGIIEL